MQTIISRFAFIGAGRQPQSSVFIHPAETSRVDAADGSIGSSTVRIAQDDPVVESPVPSQGKKLEKLCHSLAGLDSFFKPTQAQTVSPFKGLTILRQWKDRAFKSIHDLFSSRADVEARELEELRQLHHAACIAAFRQENEKVRLTLSRPALLHSTPEVIDRIFPPSFQYISEGYMEEISNTIWAALIASRRK